MAYRSLPTSATQLERAMAYRSLPTSRSRNGMSQYRVGSKQNFRTSPSTLRMDDDYSRFAACAHCGIVAVAPSQ